MGLNVARSFIPQQWWHANVYMTTVYTTFCRWCVLSCVTAGVIELVNGIPPGTTLVLGSEYYPNHLDYIELIQKSGETTATIQTTKKLDVHVFFEVSYPTSIYKIEKQFQSGAVVLFCIFLKRLHFCVSFRVSKVCITAINVKAKMRLVKSVKSVDLSLDFKSCH